MITSTAAVKGSSHFDGVFAATPGAARNTAHDIPGHGLSDDFVNPFAAIENQPEAAVNRLADANTTTVVQRNQTHAAGGITGIAMCSHFGHDIAAISDIGGFAVWRIGAAGIVVIATKHYGADFAIAHHFIEFERDFNPAFGILIKNSRLGSHHQCILFGVSDPDVVIAVLCSAVRIDASHSSLVSLCQIFFSAAETNPSEGSVTIIKQHRAHYIFNV